MKQISTGSNSKYVVLLKRLLAQIGYPLELNDSFDLATKETVLQFQNDHNLLEDGIIGKKSWERLLKSGYNLGLGATNFLLKDDEWFQDYVSKDTIYLHHTAGLHRPDYTIGWWEKDNSPGKLMRVGTSFVIGRKSIEGDEKFDGVTYRAFKEFYWAHHLGTKLSNNKVLNQKSIGIEICALGPLKKVNADNFVFKSNNTSITVPKNEVCTLDEPWRGHVHFQSYTSKQIKECERLILTMAYLFDIPLKEKTYDRNWFEINEEAKKGEPGLWTHANVRSDKTDCFPQPELLTMLNGLYEKYQQFEPNMFTLESIHKFSPSDMKMEDVQNYSNDLNF